MNLKIDKQTLTAVVIAIAVAAVLLSGLNINLSLTGESLVQAVGLAAVVVIVFTAVKQTGTKDDN